MTCAGERGVFVDLTLWSFYWQLVSCTPFTFAKFLSLKGPRTYRLQLCTMCRILSRCHPTSVGLEVQLPVGRLLHCPIPCDLCRLLLDFSKFSLLGTWSSQASQCGHLISNRGLIGSSGSHSVSRGIKESPTFQGNLLMTPERAFVPAWNTVCLHFCSWGPHNFPQHIAFWALLLFRFSLSPSGSCAEGFGSPRPLVKPVLTSAADTRGSPNMQMFLRIFCCLTQFG